MLVKIIITFFSFTFFTVFSKNILLVPKEHHLYSFDFNSFINEHNLDHFVSIDNLNVYKTTVDNFNLFKNTFEYLFDIEEDLVVNLPKPTNKLSLESDDFTVKQYNSTPWHLDRISKRHLPLNGEFPYSEKGSCHKNKNITIHTYIVDTGIDIEHPELEGRAVWLKNFAGDNIDTDCNSHGTFCSSQVGGKRFGVCKDANLFAVKVLNCEGSGSYSGILSGLNFVYKRHLEESAKDNGIRSIVSMSLGGGKSFAINRAVENLIKSNTMYVVVASGNEDSDACNTSPASARGILTANAMDQYDNRAYFSNYGKCTDIYAPGVDVEGAVLNGKTAIESGTSFSTPNIAGVMNHVIDENPNFNMKKLKQKILNDATKNDIQGNPKETSNLLVYLKRS